MAVAVATGLMPIAIVLLVSVAIVRLGLNIAILLVDTGLQFGLLAQDLGVNVLRLRGMAITTTMVIAVAVVAAPALSLGIDRCEGKQATCDGNGKSSNLK